jgi:hypothetical protein
VPRNIAAASAAAPAAETKLQLSSRSRSIRSSCNQAAAEAAASAAAPAAAAKPEASVAAFLWAVLSEGSRIEHRRRQPHRPHRSLSSRSRTIRNSTSSCPSSGLCFRRGLESSTGGVNPIEPIEWGGGVYPAAAATSAAAPAAATKLQLSSRSRSIRNSTSSCSQVRCSLSSTAAASARPVLVLAHSRVARSCLPVLRVRIGEKDLARHMFLYCMPCRIFFADPHPDDWEVDPCPQCWRRAWTLDELPAGICWDPWSPESCPPPPPPPPPRAPWWRCCRRRRD